MNRQRYLLVVGAAKSGTSSLYRYFADHPDVDVAPLKETYFFAPEFDSKARWSGNEPSADFGALFPPPRGKNIRLEATPFTMYSKGAPARIADLGDATQVVAIVRDPVARFISDHRFLTQRGSLSGEELDLASFVRSQLESAMDPMSTIAIGRYAEALEPFVDLLGRQRVELVFLEHLQAAPKDTMNVLAQSAGLDSAFYSSYNFRVVNRSVRVTRPAMNATRMQLEGPARAVRQRVAGHPRARRSFERLVDLARSGFESLSGDDRWGDEADVREQLSRYYEAPNARLQELFECQLPSAWASLPP